VDRALVAGLPLPIDRSLVDLDRYPFPDDGPTGGPEAIFDRMSIEVARGCTEGCRFCQAGMIYRPVRERDPEEIVNTVLSAVEKSGQDEVSLTALSTADVSCISPLIKKVTDKLTEKKVSLGVSSLRAYGLEPELLDQLKRVRATGLTFAPEAGTQRMRDVINKNVTEEQLLETAERVFSRGWGKMKLYFICGLPTETDEDVLGIVETGARALATGKRAAGRGKPAEVTVSVSVHVPKPHTPFQWCALDSLTDIDRKQSMLRAEARKVRGLRLKTHDARSSVLEGIFARGDRRLADVLEEAYRNGARFDSWEDQLKLDVWKAALDRAGIDPATYLGTLPVSARLPWSHIDVGLEDGFLAREYRKALASRLSPPCGKVAGAFVHETNVEDALAEKRRLVCYDCGVACDMTRMREERVEFLERLGATKRSLPLVEASAAPLTAHAAIAESPPPDAPPPDFEGPPERVKIPPPRRTGVPYRLWFEKTGAVALLGHLDLIRELPRVFRRVGVELELTKGFHPKPDMTFAPALPLGLASLGEIIDLRLAADHPGDLEALRTAMNARSPEGLRFFRVEKLAPGAPPVSKIVSGARYAIVFARKALEPELAGESTEAFFARRIAEIMAAPEHRIRRKTGDLSKMVDLRPYVAKLTPMGAELRADVERAGLVGDLVGVEVEAIITPAGAARPSELAELVLGPLAGRVEWKGVRVALVLDGAATLPVRANTDGVAALAEPA
ncbi:MAG TPA: TIGR03936 family radical SAM-associated protein, partial [Polyangiaceae bacterium]|nr:TIGR03936 family radical SAM-associated protein [Polyangiaceae bacterium]